MIFNCPGASKFKQPQPENIRCKYCDDEVEIWSDEVEAKCPSCSRMSSRESGQSCLDWCKFAVECVGEERYNKYKENKKGMGGA
jgi:hypothetical protein